MPHPVPPIDFSGAMFHGLLSAIPILRPWLSLIVLVSLLRFAIAVARIRRLAAAGMPEIDRMNGQAFEERLKILFERQGFTASLTPVCGDYGADLILQKDCRKSLVQAKRWNRPVGVKAVQEAVAARGYYGCEEAMVVTNSTFTIQAARLAEANRVVLWDRGGLTKELCSAAVVRSPVPPHGAAPLAGAFSTAAVGPTPGAFSVGPITGAIAVGPSPGASVPQISANAPQATASGPVCAICRGSVSAKVRDYCLSRPHRFGGRVLCMTHQKT